MKVYKDLNIVMREGKRIQKQERKQSMIRGLIYSAIPVILFWALFTAIWWHIIHL